MIERELTVSNRLGLHARATAKLVQLLSAYRSNATLTAKGLYEVVVLNQRDPQLPAAVDICPTAAIQGDEGRRKVVDELCIRCGACLEVAPNAMAKQPKTARPGIVALT